jgi:uncharacterized damage-inducible protein DinB
MESHPEAVEFVRYHAWANLRLLESCQDLSADQLAASTPGTFGTIYDTLVHIVRADVSYTLRLTGKAPEPPFKWDDNPDVSELRYYAGLIGDALIEAVRQQWQGQTTAYKALALMIQIVNHGIEHRTQVTTMLSQIGLTPPEIDGWSYMWANMDRLGAESAR